MGARPHQRTGMDRAAGARYDSMPTALLPSRVPWRCGGASACTGGPITLKDLKDLKDLADMAEGFGSDDVCGTVASVAHRTRCAICGRRWAGTMITFAEDPHTSIAPQAWVLCVGCAAAVGRELQQSSWRSPRRTRVAVAVVASARGPRAHPKPWSAEYWDQLSDQQWHRLVVIWLWLMVLVPLVVVLLSLVFSSAHPP